MERQLLSPNTLIHYRNYRKLESGPTIINSFFFPYKFIIMYAKGMDKVLRVGTTKDIYTLEEFARTIRETRDVFHRERVAQKINVSSISDKVLRKLELAIRDENENYLLASAQNLSERIGIII